MIYASILNGNLENLARLAEQVEQSGADGIHFDVMDGVFVDNLSFGLPVLEALRRVTRLPLDVHLMIQDPLKFAERFAGAGADYLSFHLESDSDPIRCVRQIHACGIHAGVALSPDTPEREVFPVLAEMTDGDFVLVMSVYPGLGGQAFLPSALPKIRAIRTFLRAEHLPLSIQVDGGVNAQTGALCREAGADWLVAGSYLFGAKDAREAVRALRG